MDALGFRIETPTVTEPPAEAWRKVLLDAASYIEAHGHAQKTFGFLLNGPRCAWGAVQEITNKWYPEAMSRFDNHTGGGVGFNDTHTAAEVCAALRSCAVQP